MDSVMARIQRLQGEKIDETWERNGIRNFSQWKVAICPHDDYSYAGWLYPAVLRNIKSPVVLLIGVAHKAKKFGVEDKLVFESFSSWKEPYGPVKVSILREQLLNKLPRSAYIIHDSLQQAEHSLEAMIPFLQYYNKNVEIIPVLVPYMSFKTMDGLAFTLAVALKKLMQDQDLMWGRDISILISNDAVHYGDEEWGGQNYAAYGCDSAGYRQAVAHEYRIIGDCLDGALKEKKIRQFTEYTVQDTNYRVYRWPWCGRYSVPFGLLTADKLSSLLGGSPLKGTLIGYHTSLDKPLIPVDDLKMGTTAAANLHHWVGYVAIGYK
jgi:AmmeMemoRadiSam system protein B